MRTALRIRSAIIGGLLCLANFAVVETAQADLMLTAAGRAQGRASPPSPRISPPRGRLGPLGITVTSTGGVLVSDQLGNVAPLPNRCGQPERGVEHVGQNYGNNNSEGLTHLGSNIYLGQFNAGPRPDQR